MTAGITFRKRLGYRQPRKDFAAPKGLLGTLDLLVILEVNSLQSEIFQLESMIFQILAKSLA